MSDRQCPACGGPTSLHEETVIRLAHPEEMRYRYRCVDPWCGRSLPAPESESDSATGSGAGDRDPLGWPAVGGLQWARRLAARTLVTPGARRAGPQCRVARRPWRRCRAGFPRWRSATSSSPTSRTDSATRSARRPATRRPPHVLLHVGALVGWVDADAGRPAICQGCPRYGHRLPGTSRGVPGMRTLCDGHLASGAWNLSDSDWRRT